MADLLGLTEKGQAFHAARQRRLDVVRLVQEYVELSDLSPEAKQQIIETYLKRDNELRRKLQNATTLAELTENFRLMGLLNTDVALDGLERLKRDLVEERFVLDSSPALRIARDEQQVGFAQIESLQKVGFARIEALLSSASPAAVEDWLSLPTASWHPGLSEGALLRAEYQAVPFHGRIEELQELERWCNEDGPAAVRLCFGVGGIGKTRLLMEACIRLRTQGWQAGFLPDGCALSGEPGIWRARVDGQQPTFVVVDYAETRLDEVRTLLRRVHDRSRTSGLLRIVLVARAPEEWWNELKRTQGAVGALLNGRVTQLQELTPFAHAASMHGKTYQERADLYREAVAHYAQALGAEGKVADIPPKDLAGVHFDRVLLIHMVALLEVQHVVHGALPSEQSGERKQLDATQAELRILDEVLERERGLWERRLRALDVGGPVYKFAEGVGQALAAITLGRSVVSSRDAIAALQRVELFEGLPRLQFAAIADMLRSTYLSTSAGWINTLQPDLLGEHLVQRTLEGDAADWLIEEVFSANAVSDKARGLTVLARLAQRQPFGNIALRRVLQGRLGQLSNHVIKVATETNGNIVQAALEELRARPDAALAEEIEARLPTYTVALRPLGLETAEQAVRFARKTTAPRKELARLLDKLGRWQNGMGRTDESLSSFQEAVTLYRNAQRDGDGTFDPNFVGALANLGYALKAAGRLLEAVQVLQEGIAYYEQLDEVKRQPYLNDFALTLNNLCRVLIAAGRPVGALKAADHAISIREGLLATGREDVLAALAVVKHNRAVALGALGRNVEALDVLQEVVNLERRLQAAHPDQHSLRLALVLNDLGVRLQAVQEYRQALNAAEESVRRYEELVNLNREAFLEGYAMALNNLGTAQRYTGRHREALQTARLTRKLYQELSIRSPEAFVSQLSGAHLNLGRRLSEVGHHREALQETETAVKLLRASPGADLDDLSNALQSAADQYVDHNRPKDAIPYFEEAVRIRRTLYQKNKQGKASSLASSLQNFSFCLLKVGRKEEAVAAVVEAVKLEEGLQALQLDGSPALLARSLHNYGAILLACGQGGKAQQVLRRALGLYEVMSARGFPAAPGTSAEHTNHVYQQALHASAE